MPNEEGRELCLIEGEKCWIDVSAIDESHEPLSFMVYNWHQSLSHYDFVFVRMLNQGTIVPLKKSVFVAATLQKASSFCKGLVAHCKSFKVSSNRLEPIREDAVELSRLIRNPSWLGITTDSQLKEINSIGQHGWVDTDQVYHLSILPDTRLQKVLTSLSTGSIIYQSNS
jgi:hypothetical protein